MNKKVASNIRLGIFVTLGLILFIGGIYFIGSRKNMFNSTIALTTTFKNVGGLQEGNNIRFSGINVGTVKEIRIVSHKLVEVTLIIDQDAGKFIRKDAIAMIGSEGLMGDKVVNLSSGTSNTPAIKDGDIIQSEEPLSIEDLMAKFQDTGEKAQLLVANLASMSERINKGQGTIGKFFVDEKLYNDFNSIVASFNTSGKNAETITNDFVYLSAKARRGEGSIGKLLMDESLANGLEGMVDTLKAASKNAVNATDQMVAFSQQLNNKQGALGRLMTDTAMASSISQTINTLNDAAGEVGATTEKLNNSRLFNFLMGSKKKKEGIMK